MPTSALRIAATLLALAALAACARASASHRTRGPAAPGSAPYGALSIVPQPRFVKWEAGSYRWPHEPPDGATVELLAHADPRLGYEGYELIVRSDRVTMRANTRAGLFYARQTLDQISWRSADGVHSAAVAIVDRPEYRWRGIHLDVARHFFPVRVVERYIDVAAHYKLNVFHWHLTDDQGWRLPSRRYPALTSPSSYSAADVRAVVQYAAARHVTVVPEIDMPAHADAALRAYPELSCGEDALCTSGAGLRFARTVLGEAAALFPSHYVHVGGDEVPWPASRSQPTFTGELERELAAHQRRLAGWDEIATPRLSHDALLTVWRGRQRAALLARGGNDVVIASAPLYFDAAQGDPAQEPPATRHMATLEEVYSDAVIPPRLDPASAHHVIGVQANLWTEHIATEPQLFTMLLPRALALAEIAWTPRERKSWPSFEARLPAQLAWLEAHGYPFRIPNVAFAITGGAVRFAAVPAHVQAVRVRTSSPSLTIALSVPLRDATIRYTTDGAAPNSVSPVYQKPFAVHAGETPLRIRAAAFYINRRGAETESVIVRVAPSLMRPRPGDSATWMSLVSP
ncbi:MAG TPA: family 20 glycosylhydrolase [Candidatus Elarobacter sp.]|nr:family 20 glycosylhydrolase [Candidatus Elarobacter sp.]